MKDNRLSVITKLLGDNKIRIVWDKNKEKYFISIVDIIAKKWY